jgi:RNA-binding protein
MQESSQEPKRARSMRPLTGSQRKYLRGLAHGLQPVVHVGKGGLTEALFEQVDQALDDHELIKVKFVDFKSQKRELSDQIGERLGCQRAGLIGHVAIFYRPARDPEARRIRLPEAGGGR